MSDPKDPYPIAPTPDEPAGASASPPPVPSPSSATPADLARGSAFAGVADDGERRAPGQVRRPQAQAESLRSSRELQLGLEVGGLGPGLKSADLKAKLNLSGLLENFEEDADFDKDPELEAK